MNIIESALLQVNPERLGQGAIDDYCPRAWFQWGQSVVVEPVPDGVYQLLLYLGDYPEYELTDNTPFELPEEFQPCLVDFALWVLSLKLKKWSQAANYYNIYIHNLRKRRQEYIERKAEKKVMHRIPDNVVKR